MRIPKGFSRVNKGNISDSCWVLAENTAPTPAESDVSGGQNQGGWPQTRRLQAPAGTSVTFLQGQAEDNVTCPVRPACFPQLHLALGQC